jgi:hypothetical protein
LIEPARNTANAKSAFAIDSIDIGQEIQLFEPGYLKAKSAASAFDDNPSQSDQQRRGAVCQNLAKGNEGRATIQFLRNLI